MNKLSYSFLLASGFAFGQFFEQNKAFTKQDTLKGSDTEYRNFWDVKKYDLSVEPDFKSKSIKGNNTIVFTITKDITNPVFQIDLQRPMKADKVECSFPVKGDFKRDGDFIFITANKNFKKGEKYTIDVAYSGNPLIAKNAPWDGGWVFTKDEKGNPWMSVADEGIGASIWLPVKDIWSDEPENGIVMKIITPSDLVGIGNGRLTDKKTVNGKNIFTWEVKNTINAYSIIPNIGKYVNFKDSYNGENGKLDLDYWVIEYNLDKAKKQFQQVKPMLKAFEYWFGPYPFYEDSYKLVDSPYLGMEHQSNIAYGNQYVNGYLGTDLSGTGVGLNWDYIIVHESGHEWFANNITVKDQADMWVHEGFTMYSEVLFTENYMDKKSAETYAQGIQNSINNDVPIIGKYGVRNEGSGDMYPKGASMLHTIRQIINNDEKFRQILRGLNKDFYHQTVTTEQIEKYISEKSGIDFSSIFNQYLRTTKVPVLEYSQNGTELKYRFTDVIKNINLPIRFSDQMISPTESWQKITLKNANPVKFNKNYYLRYKKIN
ncbi:M1 family metallopeptidase [Chryseobacterium chendengshani]|uniref:M1 family metallopeptidase n=1 Tax=Chryseobacterium sp. LJ668 TaxID=2864040 RepID=UPI001C693D7F|nr:M1 family metallopeptidase [Chryseobacterium sp. LJ668]MBW8522487.1 M1 family metallopeptidase [Chryseobacterium sp. LJ668]QYK16028.1 M1 family metallopeptidase [Chryseobacterium sp. LJ668]